eukprot:TRINITY_DN1908_c0_g1_i16.p1 TRINITY_DN1908_c0_g1~~TRINITY_DN1908_c0_g1_i16.p1  ORF type:complete len:269 (+),score=71.50 TRINITY_DN1908_c0_g1_i16:185-991(+)
MGLCNCVQNVQRTKTFNLAESHLNMSEQEYSEKLYTVSEVPEFLTHGSVSNNRVIRGDKKSTECNQPIKDQKLNDSQCVVEKRKPQTKLSSQDNKPAAENVVKKRKSEYIKADSLAPPLQPLLESAFESLKVKPSNFRVERTGRISDTYLSLELIGKGAYGEIRKVMNRFTDEIRAVKVISKSKCQKTENFADEITILRQLDHQNVVRLYEFYSDDFFYYIVTEYCEGGDLLALLAKKGDVTVGQTCKIVRQVLAAVEYCHKRNIVHR